MTSLALCRRRLRKRADRVIVSGRGNTRGIETKAEFFHAWRLGDGKPHRCFVRSTRSEALEAVGLTG